MPRVAVLSLCIACLPALAQAETNDTMIFIGKDSDGVVVLPAGTLGTGEITAAEKKGMMGQGGKLSLNMLYLTLADGRTVRLSGDLVSVGSDATTLATAVTTATMGMVPFITGKTATIPEGTMLTVRLDREVRLRDIAK